MKSSILWSDKIPGIEVPYKSCRPFHFFMCYSILVFRLWTVHGYLELEDKRTAHPTLTVLYFGSRVVPPIRERFFGPGVFRWGSSQSHLCPWCTFLPLVPSTKWIWSRNQSFPFIRGTPSSFRNLSKFWVFLYPILKFHQILTITGVHLPSLFMFRNV